METDCRVKNFQTKSIIYVILNNLVPNKGKNGHFIYNNVIYFDDWE